MSIIKPKLSSLVPGQLPEFIREDYPVFVAFLKAYYDYLEDTTITDLNTVSDIDTTLDSFIIHFKNEIALNFPNTLLDNRFLLPKLKELYTSKGTNDSYKLLFRILYNKEIEIGTPPTQMLRVSDGKWIQNNSIFATVNNGSPDLIVGQYIDIVSSSVENRKIRVFVDRYNTTTSKNTYEFFIVGNFTNVIKIGDILSYSTNFTAFIVPTPSILSIIQPGKKFTVGQIYNLEGSGTGSTIIITEIDVNGGIKRVKFNSFGVGYLVDYTATLLADANQLSSTSNYFTSTLLPDGSGFNSTIRDSVDILTDTGSISLYDYASTGPALYVDPSYVGVLKQTFNSSTSNNSYVVPKDDHAVLSIKLGPTAKYTGYYKNNDGFLDDTMYIQDSKYYQAFSYTIKINELFDSYKSVVKNLIHPAGVELFGEYTIDNIFNTSPIITASSTIGLDLSNLITERGFSNLLTEDDLIIAQEIYINYDINITSETNEDITTEDGIIISKEVSIVVNDIVIPPEVVIDYNINISSEIDQDIITHDGLIVIQEFAITDVTTITSEIDENILTEDGFLVIQEQ